MAASDGTPLHSVSGWPSSLVQKLAHDWITTAEQVVATSANATGIQTMATHLGITEEEMRRLVAAARAALPPQVVKELETPVDTRQFGLGALKPPRKNN
jgi:hypothetical protein